MKYIYICTTVSLSSICEVRLNLYNFYSTECFGAFGINCLVPCDNKSFGYQCKGTCDCQEHEVCNRYIGCQTICELILQENKTRNTI